MARELKGIEIMSADGSQKAGNVEIDITDVDVSKAERRVSDIVLMYQANQKEHTASVKSRSEVSYSTHKPRNQKGSGRARAGTLASPIWVHGGVAFGPKPRNVKFNIPKKMRRKALQDALFLKIIDGDVLIVEDLKVEVPKTKDITGLLGKLQVSKGTLIVTETMNKNLVLSVRNLQKIAVIPVDELNAHEVIKAKKLLFTKQAFEIVNKRMIS